MKMLSGLCRPPLGPFTLLVLAALPFSHADETLAPGVTYRTYALPGPRLVYVVSAPREHTDYELLVGWPQGVRNFSARARTSVIAAHYHQPPQVTVLAAVNASFYGPIPNIIGATASEGELLEQASGHHDTVLIQTDRQPVIVEDIPHAEGTLRLESGTALPLTAYNRTLTPPQTMVYTRTWGTVTLSDAQADLAALVVRDVNYPFRPGKELSGRVTARLLGPHAVPLVVPSDGVVVLGTGGFHTAVADLATGARVTLQFEAPQPDWAHAHFAITGIGWLVRNGTAHTSNWSQYTFSTQRHPRTVLAWNDTHWFLMAVDGRSTASIGMTFADMATFLIDHLGAHEAVNLDGGGSTTLVAGGTVRNVPSDGNERAVSNAVLLVQRSQRTVLPFADPFAPVGRSPGWDDGRIFHDVAPHSPSAPQGDGTALHIRATDVAAEFVRRGTHGDTNYSVQADAYCAYRPEAAPGFERVGIFARDAGLGTFDTRPDTRGRSYVLTWDSHDGRVIAGVIHAGVLTDFRATEPLHLPGTAWRRFRIDCWGARIRFWINGQLIAAVQDEVRSHGLFGAGHQIFDLAPVGSHGAWIDNFQVTRAHGDFNANDQTDAGDLPELFFCLRGPAHHYPLGQVCRTGDFDGDGAVDLCDVAWFQRVFEAPELRD